VTTVDVIADVQHEIWSSWMRWVFDLFDENDDGSVTISAEKVTRWKRQVATKYGDLPRHEKYSDVEQALRVIEALEDKYEIIDKEYYEELEESAAVLHALERGGVDNWEWYDDAMESIEEDE